MRSPTKLMALSLALAAASPAYANESDGVHPYYLKTESLRHLDGLRFKLNRYEGDRVEFTAPGRALSSQEQAWAKLTAKTLVQFAQDLIAQDLLSEHNRVSTSTDAYDQMRAPEFNHKAWRRGFQIHEEFETIMKTCSDSDCVQRLKQLQERLFAQMERVGVKDRAEWLHTAWRKIFHSNPSLPEMDLDVLAAIRAEVETLVAAMVADKDVPMETYLTVVRSTLRNLLDVYLHPGLEGTHLAFSIPSTQDMGRQYRFESSWRNSERLWLNNMTSAFLTSLEDPTKPYTTPVRRQKAHRFTLKCYPASGPVQEGHFILIGGSSMTCDSEGVYYSVEIATFGPGLAVEFFGDTRLEIYSAFNVSPVGYYAGVQGGFAMGVGGSFADLIGTNGAFARLPSLHFGAGGRLGISGIKVTQKGDGIAFQ